MQQRTDIDTAAYRRELEKELQRLTKALEDVGRINPDNPGDWEAVPEEMDTLRADKNESADRIEAYEENTAILKELEDEYNIAKGALKKIEEGTYGYCEECGAPIEQKRLDAYPAAQLCLKHLHEHE